uniref:Uncharacterized protein At3g06530 n=1 Tax=Rhizophora mucronata TaxID=61149 RepID=A0A2P2MAY2_RHIMU
MATSIASQLEAIRSVIQTDSEPRKRPITRPSILFDPKEAADIDVDSILSIALSGLEVLESVDERFRNYKHDLFSHKSKDLDRELMRQDENNQINASISSYLRLVSGHFQLPAVHKTLEYLIRRYKIHVYNFEDLILCALPYHDTHAFVRVVQLIDTRNSKWKFLDGVKVSGAPLPRSVVVRQCIRDMGVLEALCGYASPVKKYRPSRPVICFCTAVIVEMLGSLTAVNDDVVKGILPFVVSGLQPGSKRSSDHKAGALMIVGLLATKVAFSPKLTKSLIRSIAGIAREEAKELTDLQWVRLSIIALINLVQLQSVDVFPTKALEILMETRDMSGVLLALSKEFNIDNFLAMLLGSLVDYSSSNAACHAALISILEKVPLKGSVDHLVSKVLLSCMKLSQRNNSSASSELGSWAEQILIVIYTNYPSEFRRAVHKFLEGFKENDSVFEVLCSLLGGNLDMTVLISDSKIWFGLHHPKAEVRRAALSGLNTYEILQTRNADSQRLVAIQDALLCQLQDDDLTIVQAALSLEGLSELLKPSDLFAALDAVLKKCITNLRSGSLDKSAPAVDVAFSVLKIASASLHDHFDHSNRVAAMMFPLILVLPKTQKLNFAVLELSKNLKWPFYSSLPDVSTKEMKLQRETICSINMKIISSLVDAFSIHPDEYMPWLTERGNDFDLSKTLVFLIVMQSFLTLQNESGQFLAVFEACFSVLKAEWEVFGSAVDVPVNKELLQWDCGKFLDQLFHTDLKLLNANILICIFWRLQEAFISVVAADAMLDGNRKMVNSKLQDLFVFFATSRMKHVFKEHLQNLLTRCTDSPIEFLSGLYTNEDVPISFQVESLHCFASLCVEPNERLLFQLLASFPSLLVPLTHDSRDVKTAAMGCIEGLCALSRRVDSLSKKNGNNANWSHFLDELLGLIVQQKRLILSDRNFLPSFMTSLLGSSCGGLLVPQNVEQRFDQSTKEKILAFILGCALQLSGYGKLMIISSIKGLGNSMIRFKDMESLLSHLLKRHSQCHFEEELCRKLSKTEIKILCLLLEICTIPSSSGGHACEDFIIRALKLDGLSSEEPGILEPCVTVLQRLTNQFYRGLTSEKQVAFTYVPAFMCRTLLDTLKDLTYGMLEIHFCMLGMPIKEKRLLFLLCSHMRLI